VGTNNTEGSIQINSQAIRVGTYSHPLNVCSTSPSSITILNDQRPVISMFREGTSSEAFGQRATLYMSRYANTGGFHSNTRLDFDLATTDTSAGNTVLTLLSNGRVGIMNTSPSFALDAGTGGTINANTYTGANLSISSGTISNLVVTNITIPSVSIVNSTISNLFVTSITTGGLISTSLTTGGLISTNITTGGLISTSITTGSIFSTGTVSAGTLVGTSITGANIQVSGSITSVNV